MTSPGERGPKGDPGDSITHGERGERGPKGDVGSPGSLNDNGNSYPEGTPVWLKIFFLALQKFGVATIILLVGGYWLCVRVEEPLIASYTESIRLQTKILADQGMAINKISKTLEDRQRFSERAEKTMTAFAEVTTKNQNQLLRDHQELMGKLTGKHPTPEM